MKLNENESILPLEISPVGDEPQSEVIFCDSVSGGARYKNNMPFKLGLVRRLDDGTEYRMEYVQKNDLH